MYNYGIIGNCQINALINSNAGVDWFCVPRPDSPPIFSRLLDQQGGSFSLTTDESYDSRQAYIPNTNVLETVFSDKRGNSFSVVDFAPRFEQYGRTYRPCQLFRIIKPLSGTPRCSVSCKVTLGWSKNPVRPFRGNSHLQFPGLEDELRLTTNMPLSHLIDSIPLALTQPLYFALTWGLPVEDDLESVSENFLNKTVNYWRYWVKHCSIPSEFQEATIRSALVLKLHCYEETGAILASVTSSLPEEIGGSRNWDYRYCWLRDACFTVSTFYRLGHFEELEGLLRFVTNLIHTGSSLHPVYKIDGTLPLPEKIMSEWTGFNESAPVRVGNEAATQVQNDVYGELILILAPLYFDERFSHLRSRNYSLSLEMLAELAFLSLQEPDAGLWEHRDGWKVHSFTLLASWAGLDRYVRLLERGRLPGDLEQARSWASRAAQELSQTQRDGFIGNSASDPSPDASMLLMPCLRFPDKELSYRTVERVASSLGWREHGDKEKPFPTFLYRYSRDDGFGKPKHPFVLCSYWYAEALARLGQVDRGMMVVKDSLQATNHLGLFSEHFDPETKRQTGNFPQCYSHVGLINAAFATSDPWSEIL